MPSRHRLTLPVTVLATEIMDSIYGLRPPALDEVGLIEALRRQAERFTDDRRDGSMAVDMEATAELRDLPAAVEVAASRIA